MGELVGAALLVAGFVLLLKVFGVVPRAAAAVAVSKASLGTVRNPDMSDEQKEAAMQAHAKALFGHFLQLTLLGGASLGLPAAALYGLDRLGLLSFQKTMNLTLSWEFLVGTTLVGTLVWMLLKNKKPKATTASSYSQTDKTLHRFAFATTTAQLALADMENMAFKKELERVHPSKPVFITGLPRGGTTLLLELCCGLTEFASHRYRDMPFVLAPMLWARFSNRFQKTQELKERAHGDGMMVNADSPEALEEMVWKAFWKKQYGADSIRPWGSGVDEEFLDFFKDHQRKIVALRAPGAEPCARYISKNNLNIARIDLLRACFPDAVVVIPFRAPLQQAASLLRQHENFLAVHREDRFAKTYMKALGHFDFGENLRPIDFDRWLENAPRDMDHRSLDFWLRYWIAAYSHLLPKAGGRTYLHSHDALCENPRKALDALADAMNISQRDAFLATANTIRTPRPHETDTSAIAPETLAEADALHARLRKAALA